MEDLQADLPVKEFAKGENVVEKRFDTSTGAIVSGGGAVGYYTEDNLPDSSYTVTSEEDPFAALAQAAVAVGADGLMIETHNDPAKAKSDGAQSLTPDQFDTLMATIKPELEFFGKTLN